MNKHIVYLGSYVIQQDMRIRLPKVILSNLAIERGKSVFDIFINIDSNEIIMRIKADQMSKIKSMNTKVV